MALPIAEEALKLLTPGSADYFRVAANRVGLYYDAGRPLPPAEIVATVGALPLPGAAPARANAVARTAQILLFVGEGDLSDRWLGEVMRADASELDLSVRAMLARAHGVLGKAHQRIEPQLEQFAFALRALEEVGDRRSASLVLTDLAALYADIGFYDEALAYARRALVRVSSQSFTRVAAQVCIGRAFAGRGQLEGARVALEDAAAQASGPITEGLSKMHLAHLLLDFRDFERVATLARASVEAVAHVWIGVSGPLAVLARAELALGRPEEAEAAARRALAFLTGGSNYAPLARLFAAEVLFARGHGDEARAILADARSRLVTEAARIRDPAMRASFLERVPEHARTLALADAWIGTVA